MPPTIDLPFDMARAAMRNTARASEMWLDTQTQFIRFRLTAAEAVLADIHDMRDQLQNARDWPALAAMPGALLKAQAAREQRLLKAWVDLLISHQALWLTHMQVWSEQLQPAG